MENLKMYKVSEIISTTKKTNTISIEKIYNVTDIETISLNLLLGSFSDLDENENYTIYFFSSNYSFREKVFKQVQDFVELDDMDTWKVISNKYFDLLKELNERIKTEFYGISFAVSILFGDFCLLIPDKELYNSETICNFVKDFPEFKPAEMSKLMENDADFIYVKNSIAKRFGTQYIYDSYYNDYRGLLNSILNAKVDNACKSWELLRQASLLLHVILEEVSHTCFDSSGELQELSHEMTQDVKLSYDRFSKHYFMFLNQISQEYECSDINWSYLFLSNALLFTIIKLKDKDSDKTKKKPCDFYGFIPIVSTKTETMDSFYCDQFSVLYSCCFLLLPHNRAPFFWELLPDFIHEFSHHITTPERKRRNNAILELTFCSSLYPLLIWLDSIYDDKSFQSSIIKSIGWEMRNRYDELLSWVNPYRNNDEDNLMDSIFFLNETLNAFDIIDFENLFEYSLEKVDIHNLPSNVKEECLNLWKNNYSYLLTYTMAFREIRSDIAMCQFLEFDLKKYIFIMAKAPNWSKYSAEYTADSVFLRFGFVTRYLFGLKYKENRKNQNEFNLRWKCEILEIIEQLKLEHTNIIENLNNMYEYIENYIEVNFSKQSLNDGCVSLFEDKLFEIDEKSEKECILDLWVGQFQEINDKCKFIRILKKCYYDYNQIALTTFNRIEKIFQSRLILRDLFLYITEFDIYN